MLPRPAAHQGGCRRSNPPRRSPRTYRTSGPRRRSRGPRSCGPSRFVVQKAAVLHPDVVEPVQLEPAASIVDESICRRVSGIRIDGRQPPDNFRRKHPSRTVLPLRLMSVGASLGYRRMTVASVERLPWSCDLDGHLVLACRQGRSIMLVGDGLDQRLDTIRGRVLIEGERQSVEGRTSPERADLHIVDKDILRPNEPGARDTTSDVSRLIVSPEGSSCRARHPCISGFARPISRRSGRDRHAPSVLPPPRRVARQSGHGRGEVGACLVMAVLRVVEIVDATVVDRDPLIRRLGQCPRS